MLGIMVFVGIVCFVVGLWLGSVMTEGKWRSNSVVDYMLLSGGNQYKVITSADYAAAVNVMNSLDKARDSNEVET